MNKYRISQIVTPTYYLRSTGQSKDFTLQIAYALETPGGYVQLDIIFTNMLGGCAPKRFDIQVSLFNDPQTDDASRLPLRSSQLLQLQE